MPRWFDDHAVPRVVLPRDFSPDFSRALRDLPVRDVMRRECNVATPQVIAHNPKVGGSNPPPAII
jgi:hypothetical protein